MTNTLSAAMASLVLLATAAAAQTAPTSPPPAKQGDGSILLTVFMKHDQSKSLPEINEQLRRNGYYDQFPPAGVTVVSWYVMMGIGQVVVLKVPADKLRDVNVALENTAWGPYRTEFYPTYDYKDRAEEQRETMRAKPK